jgi:hypothetical protein
MVSFNNFIGMESGADQKTFNKFIKGVNLNKEHYTKIHLNSYLNNHWEDGFQCLENHTIYYKNQDKESSSFIIDFYKNGPDENSILNLFESHLFSIIFHPDHYSYSIINKEYKDLLLFSPIILYLLGNPCLQIFNNKILLLKNNNCKINYSDSEYGFITLFLLQMKLYINEKYKLMEEMNLNFGNEGLQDLKQAVYKLYNKEKDLNDTEETIKNDIYNMCIEKIKSRRFPFVFNNEEFVIEIFFNNPISDEDYSMFSFKITYSEESYIFGFFFKNIVIILDIFFDNNKEEKQLLYFYNYIFGSNISQTTLQKLERANSSIYNKSIHRKPIISPKIFTEFLSNLQEKIVSIPNDKIKNDTELTQENISLKCKTLVQKIKESFYNFYQINSFFEQLPHDIKENLLDESWIDEYQSFKILMESFYQQDHIKIFLDNFSTETISNSQRIQLMNKFSMKFLVSDSLKEKTIKFDLIPNEKKGELQEEQKKMPISSPKDISYGVNCQKNYHEAENVCSSLKESKDSRENLSDSSKFFALEKISLITKEEISNLIEELKKPEHLMSSVTKNLYDSLRKDFTRNDLNKMLPLILQEKKEKDNKEKDNKEKEKKKEKKKKKQIKNQFIKRILEEATLTAVDEVIEKAAELRLGKIQEKRIQELQKQQQAIFIQTIKQTIKQELRSKAIDEFIEKGKELRLKKIKQLQMQEKTKFIQIMIKDGRLIAMDEVIEKARKLRLEKIQEKRIQQHVIQNLIQKMIKDGRLKVMDEVIRQSIELRLGKIQQLQTQQLGIQQYVIQDLIEKIIQDARLKAMDEVIKKGRKLRLGKIQQLQIQEKRIQQLKTQQLPIQQHVIQNLIQKIIQDARLKAMDEIMEKTETILQFKKIEEELEVLEKRKMFLMNQKKNMESKIAIEVTQDNKSNSHENSTTDISKMSHAPYVYITRIFSVINEIYVEKINNDNIIFPCSDYENLYMKCHFQRGEVLISFFQIKNRDYPNELYILSIIIADDFVIKFHHFKFQNNNNPNKAKIPHNLLKFLENNLFGTVILKKLKLLWNQPDPFGIHRINYNHHESLILFKFLTDIKNQIITEKNKRSHILHAIREIYFTKINNDNITKTNNDIIFPCSDYKNLYMECTCKEKSIFITFFEKKNEKNTNKRINLLTVIISDNLKFSFLCFEKNYHKKVYMPTLLFDFIEKNLFGIEIVNKLKFRWDITNYSSNYYTVDYDDDAYQMVFNNLLTHIKLHIDQQTMEIKAKVNQPMPMMQPMSMAQTIPMMQRMPTGQTMARIQPIQMGHQRMPMIQPMPMGDQTIPMIQPMQTGHTMPMTQTISMMETIPIIEKMKMDKLIMGDPAIISMKK